MGPIPRVAFFGLASETVGRTSGPGAIVLQTRKYLDDDYYD
jgi:hypothetical protein